MLNIAQRKAREDESDDSEKFMRTSLQALTNYMTIEGFESSTYDLKSRRCLENIDNGISKIIEIRYCLELGPIKS